MQQVQVVMFSDLLPSAFADETVRFGYQGEELEIDLTSREAEELRKKLGHYIPHARKITSQRGRPIPKKPVKAPKAAASVKPTTAVKSTAPVRLDNAVIRAWARENGIKVRDAGKIARDVVEKYLASH